MPCSLFREILLESMEVGQSVIPDTQFLYTGIGSDLYVFIQNTNARNYSRVQTIAGKKINHRR